MVAKVIAQGATRDEARERLARALDETVVLGVRTNKAFLAAVLRDEEFATKGPTTDFIARRFSKIERSGLDAEAHAIATALLAACAGYGEWNSWSNTPARTMRARFDAQDVAVRFSAGVYTATVREAELAVRIISFDPPHARVVLNGTDESIMFALESDAIHLARNGQSFTLQNTLHWPAERTAAASDGRLLAPMSGRIVAVSAKAGDRIEAGHALIVLEAMKMEHALSVPAPGRLKAMHVAVGAQVSTGQLLAELEPT
jgi:geranyl-CoA carboxylase alpha subunit